MAPSAPTCLSTGGGLYINGNPYILLFWSQNEAGSNGTFAKLEFCTGAACSGFAEFATAPVEAYSTGYGYDPCTAGYALRSKYEAGVDQTLLHSTLYRFRVRNERNGAFSSYSNIAEFTTDAAPATPPPGTDTSLPTAPTALELSGSGNTIDLDWTDNSSTENGFSIERRYVSGGFYTAWQAFATVATDVVTYSDTGLQYQTPYSYRVRAYNDNGYSAYSNEATLTTGSLAVAGLSAPTFTSATVENADTDPQVKLIWVDNATTETAYVVYRKSSDSPSAGFTAVYTTGANVLTWTDTTVFFGVTYTYKLRAYRSSDGAYSPYSTERSVSIGTGGGATPPTGNEYAIEQFYGSNNGFSHTRFLSRNIVIVNNTMYNNGLGNIDPDLKIAQNATIDNPASDTTQIRRGQVIIN